MSQNLPPFRHAVIKPVEILKEGYALIKDQYWLFLGIAVVGLLIGGAVPVVLIGPMMCGIYMCLFQRMRGQPVKFETLFKGFDYFTPSLIASLIQFIPIIVLVVLFYLLFFLVFIAMAAASQGGGEPAAAFGMIFMIFLFVIVMMVLSALVQTFFIFMYPLIIEKKLSGVDAVKTSLNAVKGNFGGVFGLILLNLGLTLVGVLCCYIGAFLVVPVTMASYAVLYSKVFPEDFSQVAAAPQRQS